MNVRCFDGNNLTISNLTAPANTQTFFFLSGVLYAIAKNGTGFTVYRVFAIDKELVFYQVGTATGVDSSVTLVVVGSVCYFANSDLEGSGAKIWKFDGSTITLEKTAGAGPARLGTNGSEVFLLGGGSETGTVLLRNGGAWNVSYNDPATGFVPATTGQQVAAGACDFFAFLSGTSSGEMWRATATDITSVAASTRTEGTFKTGPSVLHGGSMYWLHQNISNQDTQLARWNNSVLELNYVEFNDFPAFGLVGLPLAVRNGTLCAIAQLSGDALVIEADPDDLTSWSILATQEDFDGTSAYGDYQAQPMVTVG